MIGRKDSSGFPGKNIYKVLGRALYEYLLIAAKKSKFVEKIYVATDCDKIKKISSRYNVEFIDRPKKLNTNKALGDLLDTIILESHLNKNRAKVDPCNKCNVV